LERRKAYQQALPMVRFRQATFRMRMHGIVFHVFLPPIAAYHLPDMLRRTLRESIDLAIKTG